MTLLAALLVTLAVPAIALAAESVPPSSMPLFDFTDTDQASAWRPVHDTVMGGVSSGRAVVTGEGVRFEGRVSLDNNGGFASFRLGTKLPDLVGQDGLRLRLRGDGQVYKLSLRTDGAWDGVGWQLPFQAPLVADDGWVDMDLAFEDLVPTWRGRMVGEAGAFDASAIQQIGVLIADKQEGPFVIELSAIEAWRSESPSGLVAGSGQAARERTEQLAHVVEGGVDGATLWSALRGNERLLVLATPDPVNLDPYASVQLGAFLSRRSDLDDRELRPIQLMGAEGGRLAGRTLNAAQVAALRGRLGLSDGRWTMALIGKDGGVKASWSESVSPDQVFALIDSMPMRAAELDARRVP